MQKIKQVTGSNTADHRALGRREFLANTVVIAAGLAIVSSCASSEQPKEIANNSNNGIDSGRNEMKRDENSENWKSRK